MTTTPSIEDYRPEHQPWFEQLNRAWIEQYFRMEPVDFDVLQHPEQHIIKHGGAILMASIDGAVVGTAALKPAGPGVYEFTKMAVLESHRGQGIGNVLTEAAIEKVKSLGGYKVILYSNTRLTTAIALYRKLGFIEVPVDGPYERADIKMELPLHPYALRKATLADATLLRELGMRTFYETFAPHNTEEDMVLYLAQNFSPGQVSKDIQEPGSVFIIACDGQTAAGYIKIRSSGIPDGLLATNPVELERIYVDKPYHGKPVAKVLMDAALHHAALHRHDVIWLGVWEENHRAKAFYTKWGFEVFGSHPFVLGADIQNDLLLKRTINPYKN